MKAILIDDEIHASIALRTLLKTYCPEVEIIAEVNSAEGGIEVIKKQNPDIAFVDIAMPGKSGLEIAKEIGGSKTNIIFVTAHSEYMLQALRLSAIDYLLKPVNEDELVAAVQKVAASLDTHENQLKFNTFIENAKVKNFTDMKICIPDFEGYHIRKISEILYCEADNTYTKIYLQDGEMILVSRPLINYENMLVEAGFLRIHKSYLINLNHIRSYQKTDGGCVVLDNGTKIDVSKRKKDQVLTYIKNIFGE